MTKKCKYLLFVLLALCVLSVPGCQPSYSTEMTISLTPPVMDEAADPNTPVPELVDPLDILAEVEKIAAANDLEHYSPDDVETSLLDIADTDDLLADNPTAAANITHWKHTELPVYLTVTRNPEDILLLISHTPDENGKPNPDAKKLYQTLQKQLADQLTNQSRKRQ